MPEEEMTKYGVELDEEKTKEAGIGSDEQGSVPFCPTCGQLLDNGGACPTHGTQPFEGG